MKNNIKIIIAIVLGCFTIYSCKKTDADTGQSVNATLPTVITTDSVKITGTTATVGGYIATDGGTIVTE